MRAALVKEYGPVESVRVEEVPDPEAGPGQVVVEVRAASVNFPDVLLVGNRYQVPVPLPFVPGSEFAGVVREVGPGVESVQPGDRVLGVSMIGGFAEAAAVPAGSVTPLPDSVGFREAAAFWVTYSTAYHALRSVAGVQPGDWVVVLGAAGGVGLAAVDVATALGARALAAASSEAKLAACRQRGAEATVDYGREDLKAAIRERTGGGANVVIDPVGGPYAEAALRAMRWGGRFVVVGFASGEIPRIPLNLVLLKGVIIDSYEARTFGEHAPDKMAHDRAEVMRLFAEGTLRPFVSASYPLERVADALAEVAGRRAIGKVVIEP